MRVNTHALTHTHTHTESERETHPQARQGKARQDKTRQDKTRQDKTRQDKTRQDKTRQDKTRQDNSSLPQQTGAPRPFLWVFSSFGFVGGRQTDTQAHTQTNHFRQLVNATDLRQAKSNPKEYVLPCLALSYDCLVIAL